MRTSNNVFFHLLFLQNDVQGSIKVIIIALNLVQPILKWTSNIYRFVSNFPETFNSFYNFNNSLLETLPSHDQFQLIPNSLMEWTLTLALKFCLRDMNGKSHYADKCYGLSDDRVICRWKCSIWKLAWKQFIFYIIWFLLVTVIYRSSKTF